MIFAGVSLVIVVAFFVMIQKSIVRESEIKTRGIRTNYEDLKSQTRAYAEMIASYNDVQRGVANDERNLVTRVITPLFKNTGVDIITVHEKDGYVIAKGQEPDVFAQNERGYEYVASALEGKPTQAITTVDGRIALISTVPVLYNDSPSGAVTIGYYLGDSFARRLSSLVGANVLLSLNETPFASSIPAKGLVKGAPFVSYMPKIIKSNQRILWAHGVQYDLSHMPLQTISGGKISLIIAADNSTAHKGLIALFVVCLGVNLYMIVWARRRAKKFTNDLTGPIIMMAEHSDRVAHGELDLQPLNIQSGDEIGRLSESFNVMLTNLRAMVEKDKTQRIYLENQVARLTEVIDEAAQGDFSAKFEVQQDDEFGRIGRALNKMITDLDTMINRDKEQKKYLEEKVAELLEIIDAAAQGDFTRYYKGNTDDEIGRLGVALSEMIVDLQSMIDMNKSRRSYLEEQVSQLLTVIESTAHGDFSRKFEVKRSDEIGRVGQALNRMIADLKVKIDEIEDMKRRDREQKELLETQVKEILLKVAQATDGDLTVQLLITPDEEGIIADLKSNLNYMFARLRNLVRKVRESTQEVEQTSKSIQRITEQLQSGAMKQAASVETTSRFIDGMAESVDTVVMHSKDMLRLSKQTNEDAESGGDTSRKAVEGMRQVVEAMEDIENVMRDLETSADEIEGIVKAIDEISDQTNLLALNASIEAARAGDYGRGFSVVAKEISSLATKSVESTREITTIVRRIQERVKKANESTDNARDRVAEGTALADQSGAALDQILQSVNRVTGLIKLTTEAIEERKGEIVQILGSVKDIHKISEETSDLAARTSDSVKSLTKLSNDLEAFVRQIQTGA